MGYENNAVQQKCETTEMEGERRSASAPMRPNVPGGVKDTEKRQKEEPNQRNNTKAWREKKKRKREEGPPFSLNQPGRSLLNVLLRTSVNPACPLGDARCWRELVAGASCCAPAGLALVDEAAAAAATGRWYRPTGVPTARSLFVTAAVVAAGCT